MCYLYDELLLLSYNKGLFIFMTIDIPHISMMQIRLRNNTNLFLKHLAQNMSNPPSQIIKDAIVTCQPEYRNYIPTKEAQIKKIQRVRKFDLKGPDSIEDIDIPESLRYLEDDLFVLSVKEFRGAKIIVLGS